VPAPVGGGAARQAGPVSLGLPTLRLSGT